MVPHAPNHFGNLHSVLMNDSVKIVNATPYIFMTAVCRLFLTSVLRSSVLHTHQIHDSQHQQASVHFSTVANS